MNHLPKQEIVDWINHLAGKGIMTEGKLDRIMMEAMRSMRQKGMDGFFDYMRQVVGAPVSNEWMRQLMDQMKTPEGMQKILQELAAKGMIAIPEEKFRPMGKKATLRRKKGPSAKS